MNHIVFIFQPSSEEVTVQTKPKSRLSAPRAGCVGKDSSMLPSKLKGPGPSAQSTGIPSKTGIQLPQKSGIPGRARLLLLYPKNLTLVFYMEFLQKWTFHSDFLKADFSQGILI